MLQHLAAVNSISDVESFLCTNNTRAEENLRFLIESKYSEYESRGFVVPGSFLQSLPQIVLKLAFFANFRGKRV